MPWVPRSSGENSAPPGFSLTAGIDFARAYFLSIWPALVAGLFIGAAVTVLVPRIWVVRALAGHGRASTLRGGLLSVPTMMCTCCTAPVAVGLRKRGASVGASVAFWLGNPALNPAVLAFSFFVLGWQWTVLRAAAGVLLVLGVVPSRVPARASLGQRSPSRLRRPARWLPVSFGPSAAWRCVCCRSTCCWSSPSAGVLAVLIFAAAGALLPIPTAGEIPVIAALLALGVSAPVAAALLITLPAISVPSLVMVRRVFPAKVLGGTTAGVLALGLLIAGAAALIGL